MIDMLEQDAVGRALLLEAAAEALLEAERGRRPIAPLTRSIPDLSQSESYAIARLRIARAGAAPIGYKLGYTSAAMRTQMGIAEPNYGVLLEGSIVAQDETVPMERLIHPRIEPELTFLMGSDLAGPGIGREQAWEALEAVMASLEIVDTRYERYEFTALDNIADNSSAARLVLGDRIARDGAGDLRGVAVRLEEDGRQIDEGAGRDAMGDPVLALAWLANKLAETGSRIKAGELVMTGGLTRAHPAKAGSRFSASFDGVGTVAAQF
jgi:2-keto-4-pentenoate hydratase